MLPTLKPPAAGFKRKAPGSTLDTKQYEAHRPALGAATALAGAFERRFQKADRENLLPNRANSSKLWSLMAPDQKIL